MADAALTAAGTSVSATEGSAFSGVLATFTDANPNADANDYSVVITWGDGSMSTGSVSPTAGGFSVLGMPCQKPPWGRLFAVNANTGDIAWDVHLGLTERLPESKQHTGNSGSAGPTVTAGGLVFIAVISLYPAV